VSEHEPPSGDEHADPQDDDGDERSKLDEIVATRRAKVDQLREPASSPTRFRSGRPHTLAEVRDRYPDLEAGPRPATRSPSPAASWQARDGRLHFLVLQEDGRELQLFVPSRRSTSRRGRCSTLLDVGDWLGATGEVWRPRPASCRSSRRR
jgi:lysyl-tRNA synthetase, class II